MLSYSLDAAKDVSVSCLPEEPLRTVWLNYQSRAVADKKKKKKGVSGMAINPNKNPLLKMCV